MKFTIAMRLLTLSALGVLFAATLGIESYMSSLAIEHASASSAKETKALRQQMLADMVHDSMWADTLNAIVAQDKAEQEEVLAGVKEHEEIFRSNIEANDALDLNPEIEKAIAAVKPDMEAYIASVKKHVALAVSDKASATATVGEVKVLFKQLEGTMEALGDLIEKAERDSRDVLDKEIIASEKKLIVTLAVAILVLIAAAAYISRGIVVPLRQLLAVVKDISEGQGDLTVRIPVSGDDEIGQLANAFNVFLGKLQAIIRDVKQQSQSLEQPVSDCERAAHGVKSVAGGGRGS